MNPRLNLMKLQVVDWEIDVTGNPGLSGLDFGHCYFFNGDAEFGDLRPRFAWPHVNILEIDDAYEALARMQNILRLLSGVRTVCDFSAIYQRTRTNTINYNNGVSRLTPNYNIDILIKELENPFDDEVTSLINRIGTTSSKVDDYFNLLVTDPLAREVITLYMLGEEQPIYFLINTYKILENIKSEYLLENNNGNVVKREGSKNISDPFFDSLNQLQSYSGHINTRASSGIYSRHGVTKHKSSKKTPSFEEIRTTLIKTIDYWLNHKCDLKFGRSYI